MRSPLKEMSPSLSPSIRLWNVGSPAWLSLAYLSIFSQEKSARSPLLLRKGKNPKWILFDFLPCLLWTMLFPSKMSSPTPSWVLSWEAGMSRRNVDACGEADGLTFIHGQVTFEASPFPLIWSVQPVLNPCPSLSFPFGLLCLFSTLLCWHSTTAILWIWEYYKCVTRGRCVSFSCAAGSSVYPKMTDCWFILTFLQGSSSPQTKKEYSPGFVLCWLNQLEHTTLLQGISSLGWIPNNQYSNNKMLIPVWWTASLSSMKGLLETLCFWEAFQCWWPHTHSKCFFGSWLCCNDAHCTLAVRVVSTQVYQEEVQQTLQ